MYLAFLGPFCCSWCISYSVCNNGIKQQKMFFLELSTCTSIQQSNREKFINEMLLLSSSRLGNMKVGTPKERIKQNMNTK